MIRLLILFACVYSLVWGFTEMFGPEVVEETAREIAPTKEDLRRAAATVQPVVEWVADQELSSMSAAELDSAGRSLLNDAKRAAHRASDALPVQGSELAPKDERPPGIDWYRY